MVDKTSHKEISRRSRESCSDGKERSVMHVQNGVSFFLSICNFPVSLARSLPPVPVVVSSEAANDWTTSLQFRAGKNSVLLPVHSLSTRVRRISTWERMMRAYLEPVEKTKSVALFDIGAAGDSYGALLKCRTKCTHYAYIKFVFFPQYPLVFTKLPCAEH